METVIFLCLGLLRGHEQLQNCLGFQYEIIHKREDERDKSFSETGIVVGVVEVLFLIGFVSVVD